MVFRRILCQFLWCSFQLLRMINGSSRSVRLRRQAEPKPYITAYFQNLPSEFKLGDGRVYGVFLNRQLLNGQEYVCFVLAILELGHNVSLSLSLSFSHFASLSCSHPLFFFFFCRPCTQPAHFLTPWHSRTWSLSRSWTRRRDCFGWWDPYWLSSSSSA